MIPGVQQRGVGVFAKRSDVELALSELKAANFPMDKVSVVARNAEQEQEIAGVEVKKRSGNRADEGAFTNGALGGLDGFLVGLGLLAIPGIGSIIFAGVEATAIANTLASAAGSFSGALIGLGIPEDEAKVYTYLVSQNYYLVIVNGTKEIHLVEKVFAQLGIQQWGVYTLTSPLTCRYKNAVGFFYKYRNAKQALTELKEVGYPMSQVSLFTQDRLSDDSISKMNVILKDDLSILGMPDNIALHYKGILVSGCYIVIIGGTDLQLAAAKTILEANRIEDFHIYSPLIINTVKKKYQVISTKAGNFDVKQ